MPEPVEPGPGVPARLTWTSPVAPFPCAGQQPGDLPVIWGNVPPRNPNFTGRADLLIRLGERLPVGSATTVLPSALHGMGGIGKTQIAVEYIYRHLDHYDLVWWIDASRAAQIAASLTELALAMRVPHGVDANTAVPAVREALRRGSPVRRWLLVFDSVGAPEIVRPFLPTSGSGEILITSRNPDWASVARPLEVHTFQRSESVELLKRRGPDIEYEDADRLADALGDLPLAIEQVAAWRAETGMPVDEYLRLFDEKRAEILDTSAPPDYEVPVAAAWNVSFDELRRRSPAAYQLLEICAFYSPDPIPRDLFTGVRGISVSPELDKVLRDPMSLARVIRDIHRYGLARIDHRKNTLQLHRLVQIALRNRMPPKHAEEMRHHAHLLLANYDPNDPLSPPRWRRYQDVLSHAYAANLVECDDAWGRNLVINLATYLCRRGDHDEAISLAERAVEKWRNQNGEEDPQTLRIASNLGRYYWIVGAFSQAAELNGRTLDICRRVNGENREETLYLQMNVAADLRAQGEFADSVQLSSEILRNAEALFGPDDPATLKLAHFHCAGLRSVGQYRHAADLELGIYSHLVTVFGENDPETLRALSGLILARREAGEYQWARSEHERLVMRAEAIHGKDSAETLSRHVDLAVTRRKAGDHEGALELSTDVLGRLQARYGQGSFHALTCALGLSIDLRHANDLRSAQEIGEESVGHYRVRMGEHHPYTYCAIVDLAVTLRLLGDPRAARELDEPALGQLRAALGPDHPHAIRCSVNLASDLAALGDTEAALAVNTEALERSARVSGVDHPTTLAASLNLVFDLQASKREQEAGKRYADVLERYGKVLGGDHRTTVDAQHGIRADCDIDPLPL